jgi:hypothetical protein
LFGEINDRHLYAKVNKLAPKFTVKDSPFCNVSGEA